MDQGIVRPGSSHLGDAVGIAAAPRGQDGVRGLSCGLLRGDERGVWAYYALVPGALDALATVLSTTA